MAGAACGSNPKASSSGTSTTAGKSTATTAVSDVSIPCQATITVSGSKLRVTVHTAGPAVVYVTDPYAKPTSVEKTISAAGPASPSVTLSDNGAHTFNGTASKVEIQIFSHRKAHSCAAVLTKG
jgi:hypothetical protein